jgi:hypothetical protein
VIKEFLKKLDRKDPLACLNGLRDLLKQKKVRAILVTVYAFNTDGTTWGHSWMTPHSKPKRKKR